MGMAEAREQLDRLYNWALGLAVLLARLGDTRRAIRLLDAILEMDAPAEVQAQTRTALRQTITPCVAGIFGRPSCRSWSAARWPTFIRRTRSHTT